MVAKKKVTIGLDSRFMFVIVRESKEIYLTYAPLTQNLKNKPNITLLFGGEGRRYIQIFLNELHATEENVDQTDRKLRVIRHQQSFLYNSNLRHFFSFSVTCHCIAKSMRTCDSIVRQYHSVLVYDRCPVYDIQFIPDLIYTATLNISRLYGTPLTLRLPNMPPVLVLENMKEKCCKESVVSFMLQMNNQSIFIPQLSHNIYLILEQMDATLPSTAKLIFKLALRRQIEKIIGNCSLTFRQWRARYFDMMPLTKRASIKKSQREIGVEHILQRGKKIHYVFHHQSDKKTWLETQRHCIDSLNADSFTYNSQTELKEIWESLRGDPGIVFSSYCCHNNQQVSLFCVTPKPVIV